MTCIVGLEQDGKVYIGGDSAAVGGQDIYASRTPKVFQNGRYLIGYTTSFRMGQLLQFSLGRITVKKKDPFAHLVTEFIPHLRTLFENGGYSRITNNKEAGGSFLLGYKGKVYSIQSDFQVNSCIDGMMACGCGEDYALGSMYSTQRIKDPEKRLIMALSAAAHYSTGVCEPFLVMKGK